MSRQALELSFAVRFRVVLHFFGQLCLVLVGLTAVPFAVSLIAGELVIGWRYLFVLGLLLLLGLILRRHGHPRHIQTNEAMVVVALIFLFAPLVMSYPMMESGGVGFTDAFFEAVSAATTTGLSTLGTVQNRPVTFHFARSWMQWYGGLGIVVLSLVVAIRPGLVAKRLAITEDYEQDLVGGTRAHARRVLAVYAVLTLAGIAGLWLLTGDPVRAMLYTFAAVSTGGFSPDDASLAALERGAQWLVILLCFCGAVSLSLYHRVFRKGWRPLAGDLQLRTLIAFGLFASAFCAVSLALGTDLETVEILRHGPLIAFSAQTTAGFSTLAPSSLDNGTKIVLILSMLIGGGAGSTAGGFKLLRLLILFKLMHHTVLRTCLPRHAVLDPRLEDRRLQDAELLEALTIILLFGLVVVASWLPFVLLGYEPIDALFEVVSATGTVGLSVGITAADLPTPLKGVLAADMLLGRLEMIAWLVFLYPRTWFGKRREV